MNISIPVDEKNVGGATEPAEYPSDDGTLFKVPNPDTVEPQYPFTVEDTIRLHTINRPIGGDDTSSLFVNTDDGGGSEMDQNENSDKDDDAVPSIKTELDDESADSMERQHEPTTTNLEVEKREMDIGDVQSGASADDDSQRLV